MDGRVERSLGVPRVWSASGARVVCSDQDMGRPRLDLGGMTFSLSRSIALAAVVLSGCAGASHSLDPAADADRLAWANQLFGERSSVVILTDGTAYDAEALRLAPDTTTWLDPVTRALVAVPTSALAAVERRDGKRSSQRIMRQGAVAGAVAGTILGMVGGNAFSECFITCREPTVAQRSAYIVAGGASGALGGLLAGAYGGILTGMVSSPTERFVLTPAAGGTRQPLGAGGSVEAPANGAGPPNRAP